MKYHMKFIIEKKEKKSFVKNLIPQNKKNLLIIIDIFFYKDQKDSKYRLVFSISFYIVS